MTAASEDIESCLALSRPAASQSQSSPGSSACRIFCPVSMVLVILVSLAMLGGLQVRAAAQGIPVLTGRLVAVGIPGVGAVSAVGTFHPGGPIYDKPTFRAFTQPGAILDPERILVTSTSNFGSPLGRKDQPSGAVLSIDPRGSALIWIPPAFAVDGGQVSALGGRVMLFTANSPAFFNRVYNPDAVTADFTPVANPTGISLNKAFGRLWFTSMPLGPEGPGLHSISDPDGCPLNNAPDKVAGGVFTSTLTNRVPQLVQGSMVTGARATAFLGKSPDGSGRAVFAGLHADGSLVQIHTEQGVDGLAPSGTITPLTNGAEVTRAGMVFNWVPNMILYVTDSATNSIVVLSLRADGKTFRLERTQRLKAAALNVPVDIAPAVSEVASLIFSSNTTLAGGADFYVANRGNGTIVRLKQDGKVVAIRRVKLPGTRPLGAGRLNGIAISPDATRIWVTVSGKIKGYPEGAVIELPAFGGPGSSPSE